MKDANRVDAGGFCQRQQQRLRGVLRGDSGADSLAETIGGLLKKPRIGLAAMAALVLLFSLIFAWHLPGPAHHCKPWWCAARLLCHRLRDELGEVFHGFGDLVLCSAVACTATASIE